MKRLTSALLLALLSACALAQQIDSEEMYTRAAALTKLSSAVQAYVRYEGVPDNLSEAEVLRFATKHDSGLLAPFLAYQLRVMRQDRHTIVLMCSADGTRGLLEDVGCTARLDKHHWQSSKSEPCDFTLKVSDIC